MMDREQNTVGRNMSGAILKEKQRRRRRKIFSTFLAWVLALFIIAVVVVIAVILIMSSGGRSLRKNAVSNRPNLMMEENAGSEMGDVSSGDMTAGDTTESRTPAIEWQEGWVRHNGKIYQYNEDIMTFMILGIDKLDVVKEAQNATDGGQSDGIFLAIVNPDNKSIKILAVNRDTMVPIQMYGLGDEGTTLVTTAQIAVQHGFGDGKELSCELTRAAVSELLYNLPIHGYMSINMAAIPTINDAIGGVEVTVLEDLTKASKNLKKDAVVTLKGKDAYWYTKWRDTTIFESARGRLARQKQYLGAFAQKFKEATKADITVPVKLYQELSKYMVTDITVDEIAYLTMQLMDYSFSGDDVYTMEGETIRGEQFEEFYPDKAALKDLMIQLFYEEVEQ